MKLKFMMTTESNIMSNEYKDYMNDLKNAPIGTEDHNRYLCTKYPWLTPRNRWSDEIVENFDFSWTELDEMPNGWRKAFGEQMCEEIEKVLEEYNYQDKFRVLQIKEKYGYLHFYYGGLPEGVYEKISNIVRKYEDLSEKTCIECGKPATCYTTGWISPYCDDCVPKELHTKPLEQEK